MFKNILIPTDGSKLSDKAVNRALTLAKLHKARVTGVHVYSSTPNGGYGEVAAAYTAVQGRLRQLGLQRSKKYLDRIEAKAKSAGVKFDRVAMEGERAWEGIVTAARKKRCDLIVIAARGRGPFSTLLLGSETNAVLAHSKIPVLVYR